MAYVPGYNNDIFISYSQTDNEPTIPGKPGWVDFFEDVLRKRLRVKVRMLSGPEIKIFRDKQLQHFGKFSDQLSKEISSSAVFLCVLSPGYFGSEWCLRELKEFIANAGCDRIVQIVKTPFDEPTSNPELDSLWADIKDILYTDFYIKDESTGLPRDLQPEVDETHISEFLEKIEEVTHHLVMLLKKLRAAATMLPTEATKAKPGELEVTTQDESQVSIYLAETTKDLVRTREDIRTELLQFNCRVLPDQLISTDVDKLVETVREHLQTAKLSVQLLGPHYGVVPEIEERSIPHIQYDLAAEAQVPQLVWMPADCQITDPRQLSFIEQIKSSSVEFLNTRIEDLKTEIHKRLNADAKDLWADEKGNSSVNVSLFCHEQDMKSVAPLYTYLKMTQLFKVKLPLKDVDAFERNKELLQTSDAVLLYYGNADDDWFGNIWNLIQRQISSTRTKPVLAKAIYASQPLTPEKDMLESDDPMIIKNFGPFHPQTLTPFIQKIKDAKGGTR